MDVCTRMLVQSFEGLTKALTLTLHGALPGKRACLSSLSAKQCRVESWQQENLQAPVLGRDPYSIHRCPTYQLHLPPKARFGNPKSPFHGNAGKCREKQGFLLKNIGMPRKGRSREFREIHSGDPERAFWDDFPWRMRAAKVDVLGTRDPY